MSRQTRLGGVALTVPDYWADLSEPGEAVFTLEDPVGGRGVLQAAIATFRGGADPRIGLADLQALQADFALSKELTEPTGEKRWSAGEVVGVAASYRRGHDLVRLWHVSDGRSLARVTYLCSWQDRGEEVSTCDRVVESLTFTAPVDPPAPGGVPDPSPRRQSRDSRVHRLQISSIPIPERSIRCRLSPDRMPAVAGAVGAVGDAERFPRGRARLENDGND